MFFFILKHLVSSYFHFCQSDAQYIFSQLFHSCATLSLGHLNKLAQTERKRERCEQIQRLAEWRLHTNQPVEGKCIQPGDLSELGTALQNYYKLQWIFTHDVCQILITAYMSTHTVTGIKSLLLFFHHYFMYIPVSMRCRSSETNYSYGYRHKCVCVYMYVCI